MTEKQTLGDIFLEEEKRLLEKGREEIAQEKAAWDALPESEKQRINAEREARFANTPDSTDSGEDEDEPEDDEEFHDSDDDLDTLHSR